MLDWLKSWLDKLVAWFVKWAEWIPKKIYSAVMDGLASFINAIPLPSFLTDASGAFAGIPSSVLWFASSFELAFGVSVVLSALIARFILRRIPLIG